MFKRTSSIDSTIFSHILRLKAESILKLEDARLSLNLRKTTSQWVAVADTAIKEATKEEETPMGVETLMEVATLMVAATPMEVETPTKEEILMEIEAVVDLYRLEEQVVLEEDQTIKQCS